MPDDGTDLSPIDLRALAGGPAGRPVWSTATADLNVNLIVLEGGEEIPAHVNPALDVLVVGIAGEGRLTIGEAEVAMRPGQALVIPRGTRRSIRCDGDRFAYLTCHRRRGGLWPS